MSRPEIQLLELKYCERCGGLWLRPRGSEQIYCTACAAFVAQLPLPARRGELSLESCGGRCLP